jgi:hypothetical protein
MLETLRAWLKGNKDYDTGVDLYSQVGDNAALIRLFANGATDFNRRRLEQELLKICKTLKNNPNDYSWHSDTGRPVSNIVGLRPESKLQQEPGGGHHEDRIPTPSAPAKQPANLELYNAAKLQADKLYKQTMNNRAVLFSLAQDDYTEPNTEERINARAKLALSVVMNFQEVSALYDKAEHVKTFGRLPDQGDNEENEYDHLPDHLVKQTLDNLRKNLSKIKKREQTPERIALQQKHEANIQKLSDKWHLLKP